MGVIVEPVEQPDVLLWIVAHYSKRYIAEAEPRSSEVCLGNNAQHCVQHSVQKATVRDDQVIPCWPPDQFLDHPTGAQV